MKNQFKKYGLMAAVLLLGSPAVHANCPQSSLAGTWEVFITESDSDSISWQSCSLNLAKNGSITSGTCTSSEGTGASVTGDQLVSSPGTCAVGGAIDVGDTTYTIADGQINRNKFDMSGVGTTTAGIFTFNAIKK